MKVVAPGYRIGQPLPFNPDGTPCDECIEDAKHLVVTEADSHGGEAAHLCSAHYTNHLQTREEIRKEYDICELCGSLKNNLQRVRDPEEGSSGRYYDACEPCRTNMMAYAREHLGTDEEITIGDIEDSLEISDLYPEDLDLSDLDINPDDI